MPQNASRIRLLVANGPDAGRSLLLDHPTLTIGTGNTANLRLSDDAVAGEHLQLSVHSAGVRLRDLGSPEGSWVGSLCVRDAILTRSTAVVIGKTTLSIEIERVAEDTLGSTSMSFGDAVAESAAMGQVFAILEQAATRDGAVLLSGERGVGKGLLAAAVHRASSRASGPFVAVDCGAILPALLESQLFGNERGAFEGADHACDGAFVEADGGTLFLEHIGKLPLDLQAKLLHALETRHVRSVGGLTARSVDVRVIAATNANLSDAVSKGEFRRDLYYRLAVPRVDVPSLRDRRDDILPLARVLLRRIGGQEEATLPPDIEARLEAHSWPGNVSELENAIQRFAVHGATASELIEEDVSGVRAVRKDCDLAHLPYREARALAIERFERSYVRTVLAQTGNVVVQAARHAGVERESFHRILGRIRESASK